MQDKPYDDHKGEEDVERNRDRMVGNAEIVYSNEDRGGISRSRAVVEVRNTGDCIGGVSQESCYRLAECSGTYPEKQDTSSMGRRLPIGSWNR